MNVSPRRAAEARSALAFSVDHILNEQKTKKCPGNFKKFIDCIKKSGLQLERSNYGTLSIFSLNFTHSEI